MKKITGYLFKHQFVRFLFVGMLNTIFGYSCFSLLLYADLHYSMALFFSTIFGVIFNFKSTGSLVFSSSDNRLIFRFVGVYIVIYFVNIAGISSLFHVGIQPYIGGAILIIPVAILAFLLNKRYVFIYE
jgi:putative flippase GtrA